MENKLVGISDLYLIATLISYGHQYEKINRENPKRLEFLFPDKASTVYILQDGAITVLEFLDLDQIKRAYACKTLMPMPSVFDAVRSVKGIIYATE